MLANQDGIEAFFHQLLAGLGNRIGAGIEGLGNPAVTPPFACIRGVSLQQRALAAAGQDVCPYVSARRAALAPHR
jgi:hypothetical protein